MRPAILMLPLVCVATALAIQSLEVRAADNESARSIVRRGLGNILGEKTTPQPAPAQETPQSDVGQKTVEQAQAEDRKKGAVTGAAVGATAGAIIKEDNRAEGALIGGAAGTVIGIAVGETMAKKRGDYAARYDELDKAIVAAEQKNESLRAETSRIERRVALRESQIQAAAARTVSNQTAITANKKTLAEVEADIAANNAASETAMVSAKVLEDEIKTLSGQKRPDPELEARKSKLEARRNELLATLQRINDVDTALVAQREMLNGQRRG
jgi:hypothetical protein